MASARVRRGTMAGDRRAGLGDCVILDFKNGFFATADSSDRDTTASRKFLMKFTTMLEDITGALSGDVASRKKLTGIRELLEERSGDVLRTIPYTASCTFTGIILPKNYSGRSGILLHTGDSMLYAYRSSSDELRLITENNFWMVGRTKQLFQVEEMEIEPDTVILIASYGFFDLNFSASIERDRFIGELVKGSAVEEVADRLVEAGYNPRAPVDDLSLIALKPNRICYADRKIIMGGTTAHGEENYDENCRIGLHGDRYVAVEGESDVLVNVY
jgi:hypothetical protein